MSGRSAPTQDWLLPEYIQDILPPEAARIEALRREVLELFRVHGYELVIPPLLEYVESLLTGTGHDMDLRIFKVVDQLSGRSLGLRADITPQAARIDAHLLNREGVVRLCYAGSVLHTLPAGSARSREPLQVGAELYGHAGPESDIEIQRLMLRALRIAGADSIHLDLGHVGVFRALAHGAGLGDELESELFLALQSKDPAVLERLCAGLPDRTAAALRLLPRLYGGREMLAEARRRLPDHEAVRRALDELEAIADGIGAAVDSIGFDLAELRGYHYHTGAVFACYVPGAPSAVALGGRYDEVGLAFGRPRPATGFTLDLREVAAFGHGAAPENRILAPYGSDPQLLARIDALRSAGEVVVMELPGHDDRHTELRCSHRLVRRNGAWELEAIIES